MKMELGFAHSYCCKLLVQNMIFMEKILRVTHLCRQRTTCPQISWWKLPQIAIKPHNLWEFSSLAVCTAAKTCLFTAQLSIVTADCIRHPILMAVIETTWDLHTLTVVNSWCKKFCKLLTCATKGHHTPNWKLLRIYSHKTSKFACTGHHVKPHLLVMHLPPRS